MCAVQGGGSPVKGGNQTGSPVRKNGQNKSRVETNDCANQFQVLREMLGDYSTSDGKSIRGDPVVPESALEGEVGDHAQRFPSCLLYTSPSPRD